MHKSLSWYRDSECTVRLRFATIGCGRFSNRHTVNARISDIISEGFRTIRLSRSQTARCVPAFSPCAFALVPSAFCLVPRVIGYPDPSGNGWLARFPWIFLYTWYPAAIPIYFVRSSQMQRVPFGYTRDSSILYVPVCRVAYTEGPKYPRVFDIRAPVRIPGTRKYPSTFWSIVYGLLYCCDAVIAYSSLVYSSVVLGTRAR